MAYLTEMTAKSRIYFHFLWQQWGDIPSPPPPPSAADRGGPPPPPPGGNLAKHLYNVMFQKLVTTRSVQQHAVVEIETNSLGLNRWLISDSAIVLSSELANSRKQVV